MPSRIVRSGRPELTAMHAHARRLDCRRTATVTSLGNCPRANSTSSSVRAATRHPSRLGVPAAASGGALPCLRGFQDRPADFVFA